MAQMFMLIKDIPGSTREANHADHCDVLSFSHELTYPFDYGGAGGATTSAKQKHGAVKVVKPVDKASPMLYDALCKGNTVEEVTLLFYRDSPDAISMGAYFTIKLLNCRVTSTKSFIGYGEGEQHIEEIGFGYEDITWTWEPDGVEAQFNFTGVTGY